MRKSLIYNLEPVLFYKKHISHSKQDKNDTRISPTFGFE